MIYAMKSSASVKTSFHKENRNDASPGEITYYTYMGEQTHKGMLLIILTKARSHLNEQ